MALTRVMSEGKDFIAKMTWPVESVSEVKQSIPGKLQHNIWHIETAAEAQSNDNWQNHHYKKKKRQKRKRRWKVSPFLRKIKRERERDSTKKNGRILGDPFPDDSGNLREKHFFPKKLSKEQLILRPVLFPRREKST